jgi:glycerol uptake facilitator-like aquaporin
MSGTFPMLWVYLVAEVIGGIAAAVLYVKLVAQGSPPSDD